VVTYRVQAETASIDARARAIANEQSVELPTSAIDDPYVLNEIVGSVVGISDAGRNVFDVEIALASATMPPEPGQLCNMLFGNTSLLDDVTLHDVAFPNAYLTAFGGPTIGLTGLRRWLKAPERGLTATALKPQGLRSSALASIAHAAAAGGIDIIKDDHGLADQAYSPYEERVAACLSAVAKANAASGGTSIYAPSLSGSLDQLRQQVDVLRCHGGRMALIAPMVVGLPAFHTIAREASDIAFLAHPSLAGAQRIAAPLLLGRMFRMLGADATIFPNYGGRFSYSQDVCQAIARHARMSFGGLAATLPAPAGGMSLDRVDEILNAYGRDCLLLIGGSLLADRAHITKTARAFTDRVAAHGR
jgi:ribulose-bisphosphate carboxylase large chain